LERQKLGAGCSEDDDDISIKGTTEHVYPFSRAFVFVTTRCFRSMEAVKEPPIRSYYQVMSTWRHSRLGRLGMYCNHLYLRISSIQ
jgi:hypothetical protein